MPINKLGWRQIFGNAGEAAVARELKARGWTIQNLNKEMRNSPNVDLLANKESRDTYIQVKAYNDYGWISAGSVNQDIVNGGPIFNKSRRTTLVADFVIFLSPANPQHRIKTHRHIIPRTWRHFVLPVAEAERLFHIHVDAIMKKPKADGSRRRATGAIQDWVGPGPKTAPWGPDLSGEYAKFEGQFNLMLR